MPDVTIRYFAGARAAAGTDREVLSLPAAATIADAVAELGGRHGEELARVLEGCSFLIDSTVARGRSATLPESCELDILPPFAGG